MPQLERVVENTDDTATTMLDVALAYAIAQQPIFPCRAAEEYDDITGEVYAPKTPLTPNGLKGATSLERIIREWWKRHPDAMIGAPTGAKMGAWVLDVDNKPGGANGFDWLAEMEIEHGPLPYTRKVKTPNDGLHIFFTYVPGTRNRGALGAGVDVRSEGGYVIAAGSVLADGRAYEWEDADAPIADAPAWLLELVLPRPVAHTSAEYRPYDGGNSAYVNRAVDAELADLASTPQGSRNNKLNDCAFAIGQFVGAGAMSETEARSSLEAIAGQWPNFPLSRKTIDNGLKAGIAQPRVIPAPTTGDDTPIISLGKLVKAEMAAKDKPKEKVEAATNADVSGDSVQETLQTSDTPATVPANDNAPEPPLFVATPYEFKDPKKLPRREFAFGTHYIRKYVSVTVSPGGLGKTSNSIVEATSMVSGRDLTGIKPPSRLKCWLFNAEDPRDEMERRIQAVCLHYKLKPEDINGHLFLDTGREQDLVVAVEDKRAGTKIQVPIVKAVIEQILRNKIDVMIVDPFVSTHQVNENDNGAIDTVAKLWAQIADDTNCSIDIVHHLRKVADREATVEDARGAVSLIGAARSVRVLNRMSEDQAKAAGVPDGDRYSYFNIHQGKANLTKMSLAQNWRRLESVPLGNGTTWKPQDFAGVVTEWHWPSPEEAVGDITAEQLELIKTRISNTDCKLHHAADNWVGREVAYVLGMDIAIKTDKSRVSRLVKAWTDDGTFTIVNRRCPIKRENKDFVEVAT